MPKGVKLNLTGHTYNDWLVLNKSNKHRSSAPKQLLWLCQCKCGATSYNTSYDLTHGNSKRCKSCATKERKVTGKYTVTYKYVYLIQAGDFIKIGTSDNVKKRLSIMQVGNPFTLKLLYSFPSEKFSEEFLHNTFKEYHYRGEWYKISGELCESIISRLHA